MAQLRCNYTAALFRPVTLEGLGNTKTLGSADDDADKSTMDIKNWMAKRRKEKYVATRGEDSPERIAVTFVRHIMYLSEKPSLSNAMRITKNGDIHETHITKHIEAPKLSIYVFCSSQSLP
jgi:hypothetical protein